MMATTTTTTTTMGIYSVCVRNPELQTERVTGVTIEADSLGAAYDVLDSIPGMDRGHPKGNRPYVIIRTVRESTYDKDGLPG